MVSIVGINEYIPEAVLQEIVSVVEGSEHSEFYRVLSRINTSSNLNGEPVKLKKAYDLWQMILGIRSSGLEHSGHKEYILKSIKM